MEEICDRPDREARDMQMKPVYLFVPISRLEPHTWGVIYLLIVVA
jgi:hypothetical protein